MTRTSWLNKYLALGTPRTHSWQHIVVRWILLQVTSRVIRWITWIVEKNEAADALSRLGSQCKPVPPNGFLDVLHNPSVKLLGEADLAIPDPKAQLVASLHVTPDWTLPYLDYMNRGELAEDETLAR